MAKKPDLFAKPALPAVFERDGRVFANSRDVAEYFQREHKNVLRDIDNLLKSLDCSILSNREFIGRAIPDGSGINRRTFDMTRDGFTLLAMGFTGPEAMGFKLRYIGQFNSMEDALRSLPPPQRDLDHILNDPDSLRGLLLTYTDKVRELRATVEAQGVKVAALDRIATAEKGSMCITDAAKALQIRPGLLLDWLLSRKWIYRRPGKAGYIAYQNRIQQGWLTHKVYIQPVENGEDRIRESVVVTPDGLATLAAHFAHGDDGDIS